MGSMNPAEVRAKQKQNRTAKEYKNMRMKLWSDAVVTLLASENNYYIDNAISRANKVLAEFDDLFAHPESDGKPLPNLSVRTHI